MPTLADTAETTKALLAFFLQGLGATALALTPGYLLGVAFTRGLRGPAPSDKAFAANAVAGALVVHALLLPWTLPLAHRVIRDGPAAHALELTGWALVALLVVPLVAGAVLAALTEARRPGWWVWLLTRLGISSTARTAEAWNWVFRQRFPAFVQVRLADGRVVLGWYGGRSLAASDAAVRDGPPPGGGHRGYAAMGDGSGLMVACCCSHSMGDRLPRLECSRKRLYQAIQEKIAARAWARVR